MGARVALVLTVLTMWGLDGAATPAVVMVGLLAARVMDRAAGRR